MRVHYLQHMSFENAGYIAPWAKTRGHTVTRTRLYCNEALPPNSSFDWLVAMGGPMNIYEQEISDLKKTVRRSFDLASTFPIASLDGSSRC